MKLRFNSEFGLSEIFSFVALVVASISLSNSCSNEKEKQQVENLLNMPNFIFSIKKSSKDPDTFSDLIIENNGNERISNVTANLYSLWGICYRKSSNSQQIRTPVVLDGLYSNQVEKLNDRSFKLSGSYNSRHSEEMIMSKTSEYISEKGYINCSRRIDLMIVRFNDYLNIPRTFYYDIKSLKNNGYLKFTMETQERGQLIKSVHDGLYNMKLVFPLLAIRDETLVSDVHSIDYKKLLKLIIDNKKINDFNKYKSDMIKKSNFFNHK